jgi:hypothetical protein
MMTIKLTKNKRPKGIVSPKINPTLVNDYSVVVDGGTNTLATAVPLRGTPPMLTPVADNPVAISLEIDPTSDASPTEREL